MLLFNVHPTQASAAAGMGTETKIQQVHHYLEPSSASQFQVSGTSTSTYVPLNKHITESQ